MGTIDGKATMVEALLEKKAKIMAQDDEGENALLFAISQGHTDIVRRFLTSDSDADVPNKIGQTPLMKAVARSADCLRLVLEAKANINATTAQGKTALMQAAEK